MLYSIDLAKLRNAEYLQYNKDFLDIVQQNDPVALGVQAPFGNLQNMLVVLENIFITEQGSAITLDVNAIDARRDNALVGFSTAVTAFTYHFNPVMAKHAETINRQIAKYGTGIIRQTYQAETAIVRNLLADLTGKPDVAAAVTALNLADWKKELEEANLAFTDAYLQRTNEIGDSIKDKLIAKRLETNNAYYKLRDLIDAYFTIKEGAEPYTKVTNRLNALIDQYNNMLAGRGNDGGDTKAGDEPPTPPQA